jgi:hypothetical protein
VVQRQKQGEIIPGAEEPHAIFRRVPSDSQLSEFSFDHLINVDLNLSKVDSERMEKTSSMEASKGRSMDTRATLVSSLRARM